MLRMRVVVFLAVILLTSAGAVTANPIDPQIIIRQAAGIGSIQMTTNQINIDPEGKDQADCSTETINGLPGFTCEVRNLTGAPLTSFLITFGGSQPPLGCASNPLSPNIFNTCVTGRNDDFFLFTGGAIAAGDLFFIDFVNFAQGTIFNATANVPEPGTLALLGTGLGALGLLKRKRKQV